MIRALLSILKIPWKSKDAPINNNSEIGSTIEAKAFLGFEFPPMTLSPALLLESSSEE
jgi:hypothetical protein